MGVTDLLSSRKFTQVGFLWGLPELDKKELENAGLKFVFHIVRDICEINPMCSVPN